MISIDMISDTAWRRHLAPFFDSTDSADLNARLSSRLLTDATIFPPHDQIFSAFNATNFDDVKVVILGQDPYHGAGQAMGLSFSVPENVKLPPSLRNILKEAAADIGAPMTSNGDLSRWAQQGVLLLNSFLTVEEQKPGAHAKLGWNRLTDLAIATLSEKRDGVVFVLWGAFAQKKSALIDHARHLVLEAPHPSPLSAHRGFFGSRPFSQANAYLQARGERPIEW